MFEIYLIKRVLDLSRSCKCANKSVDTAQSNFAKIETFDYTVSLLHKYEVKDFWDHIVLIFLSLLAFDFNRPRLYNV